MFGWIKSHKEILLLLGVSLVAHNAWLSFGTQSYGDTYYEFPKTVETYMSNLERSSWNGLRDVGSANIEPYFYVFYLIRGIFAQFGLYYEVSSVFVFYLPIIFAAPLGMYLLARRLRLSKLLAAIAGGVYSFNTYFFIIQTQHLPISVAYAYVPLTLYLFAVCLDKIRSQENLMGQLRWQIFAALTITVQLISEPRIFLIVLPAYVYIFLRHKLNVGPKVFAAVVVACLVLIVNAYWIPSFVLGSGSQVASTVDRSLFGSQYKSLGSALTLMHPSWTGSVPISFTLQDVPLYFWIIPCVIILGLLNISRSRARIYIVLLGMALIGIFLVKQSNEPVRFAYQWLYENVPGFNLFRESSKFYIIIALSYSLLVALALESIARSRFRRVTNVRWIQTYAPAALLVLVSLVLLANTKPLVDRSFGTLFTNRDIPSDYIKFNDFIAKDESYFRTAWFPTTPRWALSSVDHPTVNIQNLAGGKWAKQLGFANDHIDEPTYKKLLTTLPSSSVAEEIFNSSAIKYVAVPIRDSTNDDDFFAFYGNEREAYIKTLDQVSWLKKINIGTESLVVYENAGAHDHVSVRTSLLKVDNLDNANDQYRVIREALKEPEIMFTADSIENGMPHTEVTTLFSELRPEQIASDGRAVNNVKLGATGQLYAKGAKQSLNYSVVGTSLAFDQAHSGEYRINGKVLPIDDAAQLLRTNVDPKKYYGLAIGKRLYDLDVSNGTTRNVGVINGLTTLYSSARKNLVDNGSFESGAWQDTAEDCNPYDRKSDLGLRQTSDEHADGRYSLEVTAEKHVACTRSNTIAIKPGASYRLSFQYKVKLAQQVGHDLLFNDPAKTVVSTVQTDANDTWRRTQEVFVAPAGATSVQLRLRGYPNESNLTRAYSYFDRVIVEELHTEGVVTQGVSQAYHLVDHGQPMAAKVEYLPKYRGSGNLLPNPSLESGLWKSKVNDCNAYDDRPKISMSRSNNASDGRSSLELTALRHVACTAPPSVAVQEGVNYLLSFDHQSPSRSKAGYFVRFNDENRTSTGGQLASGQDWQRFSRVLEVPYGATRFDLTIYSYADAMGIWTSINRYDNFSLTQIGPIENTLYSAEKIGGQLVAPKKIESTISNTAKRSIRVEGASKNFFLVMSDGYDKKWQLLHDTSLNGPGALLSGRKYASTDHFAVNGFLNGWYVDVEQICGTNSDNVCRRNQDGTYNLSLVAEFAPQRWFYVGVVMSVTGLLACSVILLAGYRSHRAGKRQRIVFKSSSYH